MRFPGIAKTMIRQVWYLDVETGNLQQDEKYEQISLETPVRNWDFKRQQWRKNVNYNMPILVGRNLDKFNYNDFNSNHINDNVNSTY